MCTLFIDVRNAQINSFANVINLRKKKLLICINRIRRIFICINYKRKLLICVKRIAAKQIKINT